MCLVVCLRPTCLYGFPPWFRKESSEVFTRELVGFDIDGLDGPTT